MMSKSEDPRVELISEAYGIISPVLGIAKLDLQTMQERDAQPTLCAPRPEETAVQAWRVEKLQAGVDLLRKALEGTSRERA